MKRLLQLILVFAFYLLVPIDTAFSQLVSAVTNTSASHLDIILAHGALRVCTTGDYKPYSFLTNEGQYVGIDIELMKNLAKSLGVTVQFIRSSWASLMSDFLERCDIAAGGVSTTLERQKQAFFTEPYLVDGKTPIARCSDTTKYQTITQIDQSSTRVIVNPGGTNERESQRYPISSAAYQPPLC